MLVLLPPSEGKAPAGAGPPVDLATLSLPELAEERARLLDTLGTVCREQPERALTLLGLRESMRGEVERDAHLRHVGTRPAGEVYTGVLYDALGLASLPEAARASAARQLLVCSGLWGAVGVDDAIPPYRCPIGAKLPGLDARRPDTPTGLAAFWRGPLGAALSAAAERESGPVLDLRSSGYAAAWKPRGEVADRTVTVRVLQERTVRGETTRSVVSHANKATKGRLLRALLTAGAAPACPKEVAEALRDLGFTIEEQPRAGLGRPWQLDVIVTAP